MSTQAQMQAFTQQVEARSLALAFAAKYPTDNVRQAIAYAEQGRLAWTDIAALFARSFAQACTA
jgi:hypothetical protein